jgi:hypothetical protein
MPRLRELRRRISGSAGSASSPIAPQTQNADWYGNRADIEAFLIPANANGQPAVAGYIWDDTPACICPTA